VPSAGDVGSEKIVEIWTSRKYSWIRPITAALRRLLDKDLHMHRTSGGGVNQKPVPLELFIRSSRVSGPYGVCRL
jgi:hypothetical protein